MNEVKLKPSLRIYAVHSQNADLIHFLKDNKIKPSDETYEQILIESIKYHHNNFLEYIKNYLIKEEEEEKWNELLFSKCIHYHNYSYFPSDFNNDFILYNFSRDNYYELCDLYLKEEESEMRCESGLLHVYGQNNKRNKIYYSLSQMNRIVCNQFRKLFNLSKITHLESVGH